MSNLFKHIIIVCVTIVCIVTLCHRVYSAPTSDGTKSDEQIFISNFNQIHEDILKNEAELSFGHDVKLNEEELRANKTIMDAKEIELKSGLENPTCFNPSHHLVDVLSAINKSELFKIIRQMPKGDFH